MKPSVVLLTYDINEILAQMSKTAIESVKFSVPDCELIVIDNASPFGGAFSRSEADIYVRNRQNVGYPGAVNQGMALANSEFVVLSNNDIKVSPNWWGVTQEVMQSNPKVGTLHFRMDGYDEIRPLGNDIWIGGKERWCSSSFFVVRKEAFQGYDTNFHQGGYDDYDHHHRMRSKGWIQAYTNKACYQHADSSTYQAMEVAGDNRSERDVKNREYFKSKHGEYPDVMFNTQFANQMNIPWKPFL